MPPIRFTVARQRAATQISKRGLAFPCLGDVVLGWGTPEKMIRRMKVTLLRNLPDVGSALLFHLKGSKLRSVKGGHTQPSDAPVQQVAPATQTAP